MQNCLFILFDIATIQSPEQQYNMRPTYMNKLYASYFIPDYAAHATNLLGIKIKYTYLKLVTC